MVTIIRASTIWVSDERILVQKDEGEAFELPGVIVGDQESIEMALSEFFRDAGLVVSVGGLRYLVEEVRTGGKTVHLVYDMTVVKGSPQKETLQIVPIAELLNLKITPSVLFGKLLADLRGPRLPGCVTLVSW